VAHCEFESYLFLSWIRNFDAFFSTDGSCPEAEEFIRRPYIMFFKYSCNINSPNYENNQQDAIFCLWRCDPKRIMASSFLRFFLDHTQWCATVGRTPLDEWSARRRDLYLTTHNTHNRQTSMPPVGFETKISAGDWPQTYALDRAVTGTGNKMHYID
jgi:hypothetical protein